jgi:hypothetical protein
VINFIGADPELNRPHDVVKTRTEPTPPKKILKTLAANEVLNLFTLQQGLRNLSEPSIYGDKHAHQFHIGRGRRTWTPVDEIDLTLRTDAEIQGEFLPAIGAPHMASH